MKFTFVFLVIVVCLTCATEVFSIGTGCTLVAGIPTGMRDDGIYYTDCFGYVGGDTWDDERLQRAVNTATGKLIFNEPIYYVNGPVDLKAYMIYEGLSTHHNTTEATDPQSGAPRIVALADNFNVFQ